MQVVVRSVLDIPDFRKRLRLLMARRGLSRAKLAAKIGIACDRLERKLKRNRMTERSLRDIERALGIERSEWTAPLNTPRTRELVAEFMAFCQSSAPRRQAAAQARKKAA